ncbi:MAG: hypothetical protein R2711_01065 [Acidimicrobiales bacterium]
MLIAPILPGVSDSPEQLSVAKAVVEAGAVSIGHVVLHLRSPETRQVHLERLAATAPQPRRGPSEHVGVGAQGGRDRIAADLRARSRPPVATWARWNRRFRPHRSTSPRSVVESPRPTDQLTFAL